MFLYRCTVPTFIAPLCARRICYTLTVLQTGATYSKNYLDRAQLQQLLPNQIKAGSRVQEVEGKMSQTKHFNCCRLKTREEETEMATLNLHPHTVRCKCQVFSWLTDSPPVFTAEFISCRQRWQFRLFPSQLCRAGKSAGLLCWPGCNNHWH